MATHGDATLPSVRRSRKSIGATDLRKGMDKENATLDLGVASRKKSRSKSLGPGGLDALRQGNGNRRASLAAPQKPPRSILKTVVAIPEIPPLKKRNQSSGSTASINTSQDDLSGSKIALRTEEEQQAAARERDERERRDARRKSLANRRVSFAAEATLHTFHEVDYNADSTTSTDSSRRASAAANKPNAHVSTPQEHVQDTTDTPESQRDLHQRKFRRNSGAPSNFHSRDDDTAASTVYSSDSEPADVVEEVEDEEIEEDSNSDSDDDGTMMTMATDEMTGTSAGASDRSDISDEDESNSIDEALRLAARQAGTQRLGESSDEEEEIIPAFGWIKKGNQSNAAASRAPVTHQPPRDETAQLQDNTEMDMDMEMTRAVGKIITPNQEEQLQDEEGGEEEMSMDVTRAFGGIIGQKTTANDVEVSEGEDEDIPMEEATMEFTMAIGGIRKPEALASENDEDVEGGNEDMSMELTTVMGGVLSQLKRKSLGISRRGFSSQPEPEDATMDMTVGAGRITTNESNDEGDNDGEATMGMDITTALGGILSNPATKDRTLGKRIMEEEVNKPNGPGEAILAAVSQPTPPQKQLPQIQTETANSPGLSGFQGSGLRRSVGPQVYVRPSTRADSRTPSPEKPSTPRSIIRSSRKRVSKPQEITPQPSVSRNEAFISSGGVTPKSASAKKGASSSFQENRVGNDRTPSIISTPQQRRLSGVGADRVGLGSPKVAALFDRRGSIGDVATDFVPGRRGVAFADPKVLEKQIDYEREQEEEKENSRRILEREADGAQEGDITANLRDMIGSMSPKRKPMKGRKSLHVGSARGLLGKHPIDLSDDEEDEEQDGVKRLKGHQGSPVKNVKLQNPPSKAETTTGRLTRSSRLNLIQDSTPTLSSPNKTARPESPQRQTRFKEVNDEPTTHEVDFEQSATRDAVDLEQEMDEERIHLQDFLNMTSIRFMELTTTKRRHTIAPGSFGNGIAGEGEDDMSLERCVVAGACTVPNLELYQHSCRELKKYISEGRRIVKEIETDTFEENPHLFREYISATPDVRSLMDNQFKNVKTHARLLSKAMWYEWRMKLQEGLREGLLRIDEGMKDDENLIVQQQELLASILPEMITRHDDLLEESNSLEEVAQELANCDPAELESAREELSDLDTDIAQKKKAIAALRRQLETSETNVESLTLKKQECLSDITQSEKIREECRGWTSNEIDALRAKVRAIEKQHGWAVTGISGSTLSMTYKCEVEIVFDVASFQAHQPNSSIDLWYIADDRQTKTADKEFFLQCIRDSIRALPQSRTKVSEMLRIVREGWEQARSVSSQIKHLNITFPTKVVKISDASVAVKSSLLLVPLRTRVEIILNLQGYSAPDGVQINVSPQANVVYGETFNEGKMGEFLSTHIGDAVGAGEGQWSDKIVELHEKLIVRGKKQ